MDMAVEILAGPLNALYKTSLPSKVAKVDKRLKDVDLQAGMNVIDLGCGRGQLIPAILKEIGKNGKLTAVDNRGSSIELARSKFENTNNVEFVLADTSTTNLPSASFDRILSHNVFHRLPDRSGTIREIRRLLKPGGIFWMWEPRLIVHDWHVRSYEGMFLGAQFDLILSRRRALGYVRCFKATETAIGSRLRK